jgi:hypothetical protein
MWEWIKGLRVSDPSVINEVQDDIKNLPPISSFSSRSQHRFHQQPPTRATAHEPTLQRRKPDPTPRKQTGRIGHVQTTTEAVSPLRPFPTPFDCPRHDSTSRHLWRSTSPHLHMGRLLLRSPSMAQDRVSLPHKELPRHLCQLSLCCRSNSWRLQCRLDRIPVSSVKRAQGHPIQLPPTIKLRKIPQHQSR